jgi:predicted N-acetyltransferase YhbS
MQSQVIMRPVTAVDIAHIEALHDRAFGPGRYTRTAYRVREGLPPFSPLCRLAELDGRIVAAVRMAPILIGEQSGAQLLGPLSVEPTLKGQGIGKALAAETIAGARQASEKLVLLVGDMPYYQRFGFSVVPRGRFDLGGPVDPGRLLVLELVPGSLAEFAGPIRADYARAS